MTSFVYNDGGRSEHFKGKGAGDCVTRAIAIAAEMPYINVYNALHGVALNDQTLARSLENRYGHTARRHMSPRSGVQRRVYGAYLKDFGWRWVPTMFIGVGCEVHLKADELPSGRIIVKVTRHLCAVIDGVIHDLNDCSREGTRCVYGYYTKENAA
jgi:hypothetical protein